MYKEIVYFQKTERGLASFSNSKMCYYPHRDCKIHEGFAIITDIQLPKDNHQKFRFVKAENINVVCPVLNNEFVYTHQQFRDLNLSHVGNSNDLLFTFHPINPHRGEYLPTAIIEYDGKIEFVSGIDKVEIIENLTGKYKQIWSNLFGYHLPKEFFDHQKFHPELTLYFEMNFIHAIHCYDGVYMELDDNLTPLAISSSIKNAVSFEEAKKILEYVKRHNISIQKFWKETGLKKIKDYSIIIRILQQIKDLPLTKEF